MDSWRHEYARDYEQEDRCQFDTHYECRLVCASVVDEKPLGVACRVLDSIPTAIDSDIRFLPSAGT